MSGKALKIDENIAKLDFYEILELSSEASEKEIKKSYRKKALKCHPDKNPDNPEAASEFDRLKKILEILLDPGARNAYNRVLKARKAAALRAREADAKSRKLKADLEVRERYAQTKRPEISEEERFRRELRRLEAEGEKIIEDEIIKLNKAVAEELQRSKGLCNVESESKAKYYRIKVKWKPSEEWNGYSEEELHQLFYKWGEINAIVFSYKNKKGKALIEYKDKNSADMAVLYENGLLGKPVDVSYVDVEPKEKKHEKSVKKETLVCKRDFESVADMNQRRQEERSKLIEQMLKEETE